ncbi:hypothetical protein, partial [Erwinia amylovora]|uniref:hypothetical protein n=1 Tax=Erwinia amylovora TaxID=552 RepID=UPI0019668245
MATGLIFIERIAIHETNASMNNNMCESGYSTSMHGGNAKIELSKPLIRVTIVSIPKADSNAIFLEKCSIIIRLPIS